MSWLIGLGLWITVSPAAELDRTPEQLVKLAQAGIAPKSGCQIVSGRTEIRQFRDGIESLEATVYDFTAKFENGIWQNVVWDNAPQPYKMLGESAELIRPWPPIWGKVEEKYLNKKLDLAALLDGELELHPLKDSVVLMRAMRAEYQAPSSMTLRIGFEPTLRWPNRYEYASEAPQDVSPVIRNHLLTVIVELNEFGDPTSEKIEEIFQMVGSTINFQRVTVFQAFKACDLNQVP